MADRQFGVRVPEEVAKDIERVVETINEDLPGAGASPATLFRQSIQDYVNRFDGVKRKDTLFLEIPIEDLSEDEIHIVLGALAEIESVIENNSIDDATNGRKNRFLRACDKATDILFQKLGNVEVLKRKEK